MLFQIELARLGGCRRSRTFNVRRTPDLQSGDAIQSRRRIHGGSAGNRTRVFTASIPLSTCVAAYRPADPNREPSRVDTPTAGASTIRQHVCRNPFCLAMTTRSGYEALPVRRLTPPGRKESRCRSRISSRVLKRPPDQPLHAKGMSNSKSKPVQTRKCSPRSHAELRVETPICRWTWPSRWALSVSRP